MPRIDLRFLLLLCLLTACHPTFSSGPTPTPTIPSLTGVVDIVYPLDGSVIYSEVLHLSGTASSTPNFLLRLVGPDDTTISEATVQVQGSNWEVELAHGYDGEPIEVTVLALPTDARTSGDYDIATIALSSINNRQPDIFGSITAPLGDGTVGGEIIPVSGTASGLPENTLSVALIGADGTVIDSQNVVVVNPYFIDDMPWAVDLSTNGYTGLARIRASSQNPADGSEIILGSVNVTVTAEAG
jgi:hypothetical protein